MKETRRTIVMGVFFFPTKKLIILTFIYLADGRCFYILKQNRGAIHKLCSHFLKFLILPLFYPWSYIFSTWPLFPLYCLQSLCMPPSGTLKPWWITDLVQNRLSNSSNFSSQQERWFFEKNFETYQDAYF